MEHSSSEDDELVEDYLDFEDDIKASDVNHQDEEATASVASSNMVLVEQAIGNELLAADDGDAKNQVPCLGMEFESDTVARAFYNAYALRLGFGIRVARSRSERRKGVEVMVMKRFVCLKEGHHKKKVTENGTKKKRKRLSIRDGCPAMMEVVRRGPEKWVVTKLLLEHTHMVVSPERVREIQLTDIYTRTVFEKFQAELVEALNHYAVKIQDGSMSKYSVGRDGDAHNRHIVFFDEPEKKAYCSCYKYEVSGILCRHVLGLFLACGTILLPEHCILKRWTKKAKSGLVGHESDLEVQNYSQDSPILWYNDLLHYTMKFAERGATSSEAYKIAKDMLQKVFAQIISYEENVAEGMPHHVGKLYHPIRAVHTGPSVFRYADRPLLDGTAKNRPSAVDFGGRRPTEGESTVGSRLREIGEKGKKKKKRKRRRGEETKPLLSPPTGRPRPVVAHGSPAPRRRPHPRAIFLPREEKDRGDIRRCMFVLLQTRDIVIEKAFVARRSHVSFALIRTKKQAIGLSSSRSAAHQVACPPGSTGLVSLVTPPPETPADGIRRAGPGPADEVLLG
ncbi:hypothetical protein GW17_00004123 [Ensete ventricosum]|nr:hypothetical protein GW17_00004123 [Ensete ventricosum]